MSDSVGHLKLTTVTFFSRQLPDLIPADWLFQWFAASATDPRTTQSDGLPPSTGASADQSHLVFNEVNPLCLQQHAS